MTAGDAAVLAVAGAALCAQAAQVWRSSRRERPPGPRRRFRLLRRRRPAPVAGELQELHRLLWLSTGRAHDARVRLVPLLRGIATQRLRAARGIDLERDPDAARAALGEPAYRLLEPTSTRLLAADRHAPGLSREELAALVRALRSLE